MRSQFSQPKGTRLALVLLLACSVASLSLAGCSSAGAAAGGSGGSDGSQDITEAAKIAKLANTKLLYGPTTGEVDPSEVRAPEASDIKAFTFDPAKAPKKIALLSCAAISTQCVHTAAMAKAYLDKLGIEGVVINSDYTPAGNQKAMNAALAQNVDAIITYAIAPSTIGAQVAKAQAAGIPVIDGIGTKETDKGDMDAYVPQGSNMSQVAVAAQLTVASKGVGQVVWLSAPEFPQLEVEAGTSLLKKVCPGCTLKEGTETAAQVTNPVQMGQLVTAMMRKHAGTEYLTLASACADLQSAAAALRQLNAGKLAAGGCGASAIAAMNAGNLAFATGSVEPWSALASIDQALRLTAGQDPLPETETGPASYLVTPESTPDKGTSGNYGKLDRWCVSLFDFVAPYSEAWGVDLSDVIASEK